MVNGPDIPSYETTNFQISTARAKYELAKMLGCDNLSEGCLLGMSILDIACGCDPVYGDRTFPPAFPILASNLGADRSIGIDKFPYTGIDKDKYTHIVSDITQVKSLSEVTGQKEFDLIHCGSLTGEIPSPSLGVKAGQTEWVDLHIIDLAEAALKEGGFLLLNGIRYTKTEGRLVDLRGFEPLTFRM